MADISILARLLSGAERNVDISSNTLVTTSIKVGGGISNTELTKAILDRLVALQNGTDVDATYHTHDTLYYRKSQLNAHAGGGGSGADLIGDGNTYVNISPSTTTVEAALAALDSAVGASTTALDGSFRIENTSDPTKKIAFSAASISTATTRTITMPDSNVDLGKVATAIQRDGSVAFTANQPMAAFKLTGLGAGTTAGDSVRYEQAILISGANAFAADQSFGGFKATNLADPVSGQDAVTLTYLQARLAGLKPKQAVRAATTTAGTLATSFANGSVIDGITLATGDRILIKDQAAPAQNGIYTVNASGAPTRATDFDSVSPIDEINGAWVSVQLGTVNAGIVYTQYGVVTTIGTDAINFEYFNPIAGLVGGDMITFTGSVFSVDLATVSGLESTNPGNVAGQLRIKLEASNPSLKFSGSNEIGIKFDPAGAMLAAAAGTAVQVDNSTIEISSNALRVKDAGITLAKLASNSVDENKIVSTAFNAAGAITGGGGSKIAVQVDNTSVEISSNALRVKTGAYDQATIVGGSGTPASVASAPLAQRTLVAGESFAADTSFLVRWAISGETAGRVYKADKDATSAQHWAVIGLARSVAGVSAGGSINVVMLGEASLGANDSAFSSGNVGLELFLGSAGAFILGASLANTTNEAQVCVGVVQTTAKIWVDFKQLRGIA